MGIGLGWNINVGGMITQSAVGCIDLESEYSNLYSTCDDYFPEGSYPSYNLKNYKPYDDSKYSAFFQYGNAGKIQPDVFYYSYPSNAGKFCYDYREGKACLLDDGYYNADRLSKRLLLKAVYESDEQSHRNNMMSFSYIYPEMLPMKTSLSIDYWGYYNGRHNNCIIPDYNKLYYAQSSEARNMQTDTGNRSCDTVLVKYGMLDSIRYQTGGITAFEYEPHKYASAHPIPPFIDNGDSEKILKTEDLLDRNSSTDKRSVFFTVQDEQKIRVEAVLSRGMWSWKDLSDANCEIVSYTDKTPKLVKRLSFTPKSSDAPYSSALAVVTVLGNGSYGIYINLPDNIGDQSEISSKHASLKATVILYSKKKVVKRPTTEI